MGWCRKFLFVTEFLKKGKGEHYLLNFVPTDPIKLVMSLLSRLLPCRKITIDSFDRRFKVLSSFLNEVFLIINPFLRVKCKNSTLVTYSHAVNQNAFSHHVTTIKTQERTKTLFVWK